MKSDTRGSVFWLMGTLLMGMMLPISLLAQSVSWQHTGGPAGGDSPYEIFVTSGDTIFVAGYSGGVWSSADDGEHWNRLYGTFGSFSGDILLTPDGRLFEGNSSGIRYSDDNGQTWTEFEMEDGVENLKYGYGLLAAHMEEDNYEVNDSYLKVTTDLGKTGMQAHVDSAWGVNTLNDIAIISSDSILAATNIGVLVLTVPDSSWHKTSLTEGVSTLTAVEGRIYADMFRSTNMGVSWDSLESYPMSEMTDLAAAPTGDLYAAVTLDTLFHSPDFGETWNPVPEEGLARLDIRSMAADRYGNFYLGLYESGVFKYSKSDGSWRLIGPPTTTVLDMHTLDNGDVLAGTEKSGLNTFSPSNGGWSKTYGPFENKAIGIIGKAGDQLIMSRRGAFGGLASVYFLDDNGNSWTGTDSALTASGFPDLTATAFVNHDSEGMFIGTLEGGIYRSTHGNEWTAVNDSLPSGGFGAKAAEIFDMAIDANGNIYAALDDPGLYQWNSSGSYWAKVQPAADTLLDDIIESIAVHPDGTVFAGEWVRPAGSSNWNTLHVPSPERYPPLGIDRIETSPQGDIYAVTPRHNVFRSTDMGRNWKQITDGLPEDERITDLAFSGDKVLLAVEYSGVYQWSATGTSIDPKRNALPDRITLHDNYPNPFNPSTHIRYTLNHAADVQLTVYDVLGRRVATLINAPRKAGRHRVTFDAGYLSSGVYIYQLKTEQGIQSKKMLLLK